MLSNIAVAGLFLGGLGSSLAALLAVANRKLYVYEDPRIDQLEQMLPKSNCGACGSAGCRAFAEGLITGKYTPAQCTVSSADDRQGIADFLGVGVGEAEKRVARLACAGGNNVARQRAHYEGLQTCRAANLVAGGGKGCVWGCLGLGDCEVVCTFGAIHMNEHGLPVVDEEKCTACGDCVEVCPKKLFSLHPVSHHLWVACANLDTGDAATLECEVVCDGCGRCAMDSTDDIVEIRNNLATIDYSKNGSASRKAIERCPTGAIVWFDNAHAAKGAVASKKTRRQEPLPPG